MECAICSIDTDIQFLGAPVCSAICYKDRFWLFQINTMNGHVVIVDGTLYRYYPTSVQYGIGQKTLILFDNGRKVITRNLQRKGRVPEKFKDQLKDNAKFIKRKI